MWQARIRQRLRQFYEALFPEGHSPASTALAVFVGVFIGVLPTLGFALPLTAVVAGLCRLPKGPALVASFVATPPTLFLFFYPSGLVLGKYMLNLPESDFDFVGAFREISFLNATAQLAQLWAEARRQSVAFLVGMPVVAFVTGILVAFTSYWIIVHRQEESE